MLVRMDAGELVGRTRQREDKTDRMATGDGVGAMLLRKQLKGMHEASDFLRSLVC